MDRSIPIFNRVVVEKIQKNNLDLHHKRLEQIKVPEPPATSPLQQCQSSNPVRRQSVQYPPVRLDNAKANMLEQERRTQIQRNNVILFNKMNRIMNRSANTRMMNTTASGIRESSRLRESNQRIFQQNKFLVQRLSNQKPTISAKKQYEDRLKKQRLLKFMGKYPYFKSPHQNTEQSNPQDDDYSPDGYTSTGEYVNDTYSGTNTYEVHPPARASQSYYQSTKARSISTVNPTNHSKNLSPKQDRRQINHSEIIPLFKRKREIQGTLYMIQISRLYNQYEFRVTNLANSKEYTLYMNEIDGNKLLSSCDYDYGYISSCFSIINSQLCISDQAFSYQKPPRSPPKESTKPSNALYNEQKLKNYQLGGPKTQPDQPKPATISSQGNTLNVHYQEALDQELDQS